MSNSFFQFKQFTIHQENCAMKVCTDSCLFGAYVAANIQPQTSNLQPKPSNILDIGTGTGLLALMLAQKSLNTIDSIEIDKQAYDQAKQNFAQSPWKERLHIFNVDALQFIAEKKYDFIISNPPFFEADLKSANNEKNAAKHDTSLTLDGLLNRIDNNLAIGGKSAVVLPYSRLNDFEKLLQSCNFYIEEKILVKQTPNHNYFRVIFIFSKIERPLIEKAIIIKDEHNNYTNDFVELLKDYYLHL